MTTKNDAPQSLTDVWKRSRAMWLSYALDVFVLVLLAAEPLLPKITAMIPSEGWTIVVTVALSVAVKVIRVVSFQKSARSSLGSLLTDVGEALETKGSEEPKEDEEIKELCEKDCTPETCTCDE